MALYIVKDLFRHLCQLVLTILSSQLTNYSMVLREIDTIQDEPEYVQNVIETAVRKVGCI